MFFSYFSLRQSFCLPCTVNLLLCFLLCSCWLTETDIWYSTSKMTTSDNLTMIIETAPCVRHPQYHHYLSRTKSCTGRTQSMVSWSCSHSAKLRVKLSLSEEWCVLHWQEWQRRVPKITDSMFIWYRHLALTTVYVPASFKSEQLSFIPVCL